MREQVTKKRDYDVGVCRWLQTWEIIVVKCGIQGEIFTPPVPSEKSPFHHSTNLEQQQKLGGLKSITEVEGAWIESHPRSLTAVSLKGDPP